MLRYGVIGLGGRIDGMLSWNLMEGYGEFKVTAVADPNTEGTKKKIEALPNIYDQNARIYENADDMLEHEELDGVFVGTRCSLHTDMAIKVIKKGIPLFLEKPVCTSLENVVQLNRAREKYNPKAIVSFPLRTSLLSRTAKEIIDSGKIGTVEQVQAYNDVPYGRVYYRNWYRDVNETGGLWLQKATHDIDLINYILGAVPEKLCAMSSTQIFKGNMPDNIKCTDCERRESCPESDLKIRRVYKDETSGDYCSFSSMQKNQDSGSVLMKYASGMHAMYSQNFFARFKAGRRGGRYYGYKGTLELDLTEGEIRVMMHTCNRVDTYKFDGIKDPHFGGDTYLQEMFFDMCSGKQVEGTLKEGIESALICLCARESCAEEKFVRVPKLSELTV